MYSAAWITKVKYEPSSHFELADAGPTLPSLLETAYLL